jgi:hypothetical protein
MILDREIEWTPGEGGGLHHPPPNPIQTIRKILRKSNIELASLIKIQPWTEEIKERIKALMEKIQRYGVINIFIYPIYLFWILIFILLQVLYKKLFIFTGVFVDFDPWDVPMENGVGTNAIATLKQHHTGTSFTQTGTPSRVDVSTTPEP